MVDGTLVQDSLTDECVSGATGRDGEVERTGRGGKDVGPCRIA